MGFNRPEQYFLSLPCSHSIPIQDRTVQTLTIHASAIRSHTILSAPAMRARESHGLRASIYSDSPRLWTPKYSTNMPLAFLHGRTIAPPLRPPERKLHVISTSF